MAQENSISQELADLLVTNNFDPEYRDEGGQSSGPADANTISFDYRSASGNNYGSAVAVIGDDNELMLFFGDNLGRSMQDQDKDEWFAFLNQMRKLAQTHRYTFSPQNLSRLKHSLAGQAAVKEGLFEGYYGSRRESFIGEPTEARILIKHNKIIGEDDKRYRYIESIFIETADGERFKLQSNRLIHGRAMLEHVRQGGRPYDVRGNHINEMVQELSVLSRFNRAKQHHVYEGITQELVESAAHYYRSLQENLKRLSSSRGYHTYFESWAPDQIDQQESLVEDLKNMFVQQTLDTRIEAALPTLAKIQQQGTKMKEAEIFENYMNRLSEGTWALPDTPEAYEKLQQLMTGELIVGADAMNATEQLYDLVGDDELFDILNDLADNDPRANIWDDSDVQRRLAELGVQTPQSTQAASAAVPQDTAPPAVPPVAEGDFGSGPHGPRGNQAGPMGDDPDVFNYKTPNMDRNKANPQSLDKVMGPHFAAVFSDPKTWPPSVDARGQTNYVDRTTPGVINKIKDKLGLDMPDPAYGPRPDERERLAKRYPAPTKESAELARMLKHAGVPLREGVLTDSTGSTMEHIKDRFRRDIKDFTATGDMSDDLYDALYDYYFDDMPYAVKKAKSNHEDQYQWIGNRFADDLGINENLISPMIMPVSEGSCNMTMEGEYCPEHGLMECGMYEQFLSEPIASKPDPKPDVNFVTSPPVPPKFTNQTATSKVDYSIAPKLPKAQGLGNKLDMDEDGGAVGMPYNRDEEEYIPRVEISGFGPDFEDLPAGKKLINPIQPRRHNELSPLKSGDSTPHSPVANVDLTMDEGNDDPINSNSAMTGSYYEGKETDIQEGDALLARIKSLALLR